MARFICSWFNAGSMVLALMAGINAAGETSPNVLLEANLPENVDAQVLRPDFSESSRVEERRKMVRNQIRDRGVRNTEVLTAMRAVPRHQMVPASNKRLAYADRPLPIGHGQTISQPYIVGLMTELLKLEPGDRVLEVGTGSGYQAAILAMIVREVVTIEIIAPLAERAAQTLEELNFTNLHVLHGDGYFGYPQKAPYDAVIVTAAAEHIPPPLISQLAPGGRMVIPLGSAGWTQNLVLVRKNREGKVTTQNILPVRFVPLTGKR